MANRKEYHQQYRQEHKEYFLLKAKEWKESHPGYHSERAARIKIETLTHYGNNVCACVQCGEKRLACLSLDHINNNGAEERRKWFGRNYGGGGVVTYRKLQKLSYPEGYQTLCMNCQWVKRIESMELGKT